MESSQKKVRIEGGTSRENESKAFAAGGNKVKARSFRIYAFILCILGIVCEKRTILALKILHIPAMEESRQV